MARPKVNLQKLSAFDRSGFMEFEAQVLGAIERDEQQRRQERLEEQGGRRRRRRRR
ncbi:MAG: hypothetical protein N2512_04895 [Armatimonadetes bacterium]|nr:hypothetical protein [Armatimonadota bacterium]